MGSDYGVIASGSLCLRTLSGLFATLIYIVELFAEDFVESVRRQVGQYFPGR